MLDKGLPKNHDDWPGGLRETLARFVQGDVVEQPPLFYYADTRHPIWIETRNYAQDSDGAEVVEAGAQTAPKYGMITTQTCDLAEEGQPKRPWIQVAPVYDASRFYRERVLQMIRRGQFSYLVHVPGLQGNWVADLRIECPVEKGWFVGREPIRGFPSVPERQQLAARLGWLRSRVAFSRAFIDYVQRPLSTALAGLADTDPSLLDQYITDVAEVGANVDDPLSPTLVELVALGGTPVDEAVQEWFRAWWDQQHDVAAAHGMILQPTVFATYGALSAEDYRRLHMMGDLIPHHRP